MPRRTILLSVLACLCLAPDVALAVTTRDATPNVGGSQVDPSVAVTPTGQRLIAATDAATQKVRIWKPIVSGSSVTWSNAIVPGTARQSALAWNGGPTAYISTAASAGCTSPGGISVRPYTVGAETIGSATAIVPFHSGGAQTWPREVLGAVGTDHAGEPITVADEEDCSTGKHDVVIAWPGSITRIVDAGSHPDVAVLGSEAGTKTGLMIAYLGAVAGGDQDVLVRHCTVSGTFTVECDPAVKIEEIKPPPPVVVGDNTVAATAAPSIGCDAGACHVAWTEDASGGQRSRVFVSSAAAGADALPYTGWSQPQQVASSTTSSQLMPSVSGHGPRVDVVYVDTRLGSGKFDTFQTSLDGTTRGRDISLSNNQGYNPDAAATLGTRTAVGVAGGPGTPGVVMAYFPDTSGDLGAVSESELPHGTTPPVLPAAGPAQVVAKNTAFTSSWANWSDPDGDPVTLTVTGPSHGTFSTAGIYSPTISYAGSDVVRVTASDRWSPAAQVDHAITVTNQRPTFDAPAPAIVDEGGATVTVPLHADDPDALETIVYSIASGDPLLTTGGRATIVNSALQLKIPAGVRALAPLQITLRARDTTTGAAPLYDDQDLSVTIRPDLRTPATVLPVSEINVTGIRATMTADVQWDDPSRACLTSVPLGCHVRRVWNFGDGSAPVTTTDMKTVAHNYPRAGAYAGQVTTWVLWGASQAASPPKSFSVAIHDDGRVLVGLTPWVKRNTPTTRQVRLTVTARTAGTFSVSITYAGKRGRITPRATRITLKAGQRRSFYLTRISLRALKSRRATIKISGWGGLAAGMPQPTPVYRSIILR